jgi:hypothetical protein
MARPSVSEKYADHLASLLDPGEELTGVCAASEQQGMFKGRGVLLAITDRRLLIVGLDRRGRPDGAALGVRPEDVADADVQGAGGGWAELTAAVMDKAAVQLKVKLHDGGKHKFMLMRGTGPLGGLGGGEDQRNGVEALAAFFAKAG